MLDLQPISFAEACTFVAAHHSHHKPPQGHKFSLAVNDGEKVVGVVMVGRPVARMADDGYTLEVTRCCTDKTPHVASKLYAAAWRATRALGYRRLKRTRSSRRLAQAWWLRSGGSLGRHRADHGIVRVGRE